MNLKKLKPSPGVRKWIYRVGVAVSPLLVVYGVLEKEDAALWVSLLYTVLGFGVAHNNVNDDEEGDEL